MRILIIATILAAGSFATAGELTKEQCLEAHSRGQDVREQGKLSLARKLFLVCAQASCPALVQNDCARFADDLARLQPTASFVARDGNGVDLPDTTVYVDDVLVVTRLDDGRPHDIDPGKHTVRFTNGGHEHVVTIVIGSGEQGRTIVATFGAPSHPAAAATTTPARPEPPKHDLVVHTTHPPGSRVVALTGGALAVAAIGFGVFELTRVPSACDLSAHQCSAAPGDPVFGDAQHAVHLANLAWAAAGIGLVTAAGATVWYYSGAKTNKERLAVAPWVAPGTGGLVLAGSL